MSEEEGKPKRKYTKRPGQTRSTAGADSAAAQFDPPASDVDPMEARGVSKRAIEARRRTKNLGHQNLKLQGRPIPGFSLHWCHESNIEGRLDRGWEFVSNQEQGIERSTDDAGSKVRKFAGGHNERGEPYYLYLMKLPVEWKAEDDAIERRQVEEVEKAIRRGTLKGTASGKARADSENEPERYVPKGGIRFKESIGKNPA